MAYRVRLTSKARGDADAIYRWVMAESPLRGPVWFEALMDALGSLNHLPSRCTQAREAAEAGRRIRCLIFGQTRNRYRILYEVDEPRRTVWIIHIRHGALRDLEPTEL